MGSVMRTGLYIGMLVAATQSVQPAAGLDLGQAEIVVGIMEAHVEVSGESIYHGGAGDVFEYDMEGDGVIAAAGFACESWVAAYDAVMNGYLANIPQEEFDAAFSGALARLDGMDSLSDEQKMEIRREMEPHVAAAEEARREGAAHAALIEPLMPRLRAVVGGN